MYDNDTDDDTADETDEITLGDQYHLEGELRTVEVAMLTHDGHTVVLETVGTDWSTCREYVIPKDAIVNSHVAVPA